MNISSYIRILLIIIFAFIGAKSIIAQERSDTLQSVYSSDTTLNIMLPEVYVGAVDPVRPLSYEERREHWRRIRDVKKVFPYAQMVVVNLIETYEYLETLPEDEKEDHLEKVQKEFKERYEPEMRKLTVKQGQLLIKFIYRQSGSTGYELVSAMLGGFKAWYWSVFARFVGTNLKAKYDPINNEDDALSERILRLYLQGRL